MIPRLTAVFSFGSLQQGWEGESIGRNWGGKLCISTTLDEHTELFRIPLSRE